MSALGHRYDAGQIVAEVRQLEQRLAHTHDRDAIDKLLDEIDALTAKGLDVAGRRRTPGRDLLPNETSVGAVASSRPHPTGRRAPCLRLVKR